EGGWLLDKDGYRYLQDYELGTPELRPVLKSMELGPRDRLSQAFMKEQVKERTIKGPYGDYVHLDVRHLGEQVINTKIPFARGLARPRQRSPPGNQSRILRSSPRRTTSIDYWSSSSCSRLAERNGSQPCARRCRRSWSRVLASIVTPAPSNRPMESSSSYRN